MKLNNPFSTETRWLFFDKQYKCDSCGGNGSQDGGTELNHIKGRCSNSPYNANVLCKKCHSKVGHSFEEESKYLKITKKWLEKIEYKPSEEDLEFIKLNKKYYE